MKRSRKTAVWIIGILAGVAIILAALYHIPMHRHIDVTMYDDAGNPSDMQMELTIRRSVFSLSRPRIEGTIAFEGKQYESTPFFEKHRAYYFVDTEQLNRGGTIIALEQNALYFPFIDYQFAPSDPSDLTDSYLFMLQTKDGEGITWRSYIQDN